MREGKVLEETPEQGLKEKKIVSGTVRRIPDIRRDHEKR